MKRLWLHILGAASSIVPFTARAQTAFVTLTAGDVSVSVDSFGQTGAAIGTGFFVGTGMTNMVYEHLDYFFAPGATLMQTVGDSSSGGSCTITVPIASDTPDHATSMVQCGLCTFEYDFRVDGTAHTWTTNVVASGCTLGCYYAYTDYDIFTNQNNEGSYQVTNQQYVVHHNMMNPEVHYLLTSPTVVPDHFQQGNYPSVQTAITNSQMCVDLNDTPAVTDLVDWTGALQFSTFTTPQTIRYVHGRDDTVAFP